MIGFIKVKNHYGEKIKKEHDLWLENKGPISYLLVVINNIFNLKSSPKTL